MRDPDDNGHPIINPETAPIIRRIFDLALDGMGNMRIYKKYGADFDKWFDGKMRNGETRRAFYMEDFDKTFKDSVQKLIINECLEKTEIIHTTT